MYCYSFVLVNRENQESLDNYKRSICISFSACLGNGVPSPLHWPTPAELVLFNNTAYEELRKGPNIHYLYTQYLKLRIIFCDFLNGYMFDLRGSHELILWTSITEHYKKQCLLWCRCHVFLSSCVFRWKMSCFKLLRLQAKNVLLSPKNINSYGFSLQSFEIIVSLKLVEMWTVMFTKGVNNFIFGKFQLSKNLYINTPGRVEQVTARFRQDYAICVRI